MARALRIAPGLWVCLCLTAFVVAPVLYLHQMHTTTGFWHADDGPFAYVRSNWWTGLGQLDISGVMATEQLVYLAVSLVGTFAVAIPSWFLVEKQALRLKRWKPRFRAPGRYFRARSAR